MNKKYKAMKAIEDTPREELSKVLASMGLTEVITREDASDDTVSDRFCFMCERLYHGKHSKCPHGDRVTSMIETI